METILHRGPSGHEQMIHAEKANSDFANSSEITVFLSNTGLRKLHLPIMKQSTSICAKACVGIRKRACALGTVHIATACMFVHLLACIRAIKEVSLGYSFRLSLKFE